jgi:hypothetical protein
MAIEGSGHGRDHPVTVTKIIDEIEWERLVVTERRAAAIVQPHPAVNEQSVRTLVVPVNVAFDGIVVEDLIAGGGDNQVAGTALERAVISGDQAPIGCRFEINGEWGLERT